MTNDNDNTRPPVQIDFTRLTKVQVSAMFGVDPKSVTRWQNEGLPFIAGGPGSGHANLYSAPECIKWKVRRETRNGLDHEEEKAKLVREQTEAAKRRNALAAGDVISLKVVREVLQRFCYGLRQKIVACGMSREEKQSLLGDIRAMREADFTNTTDANIDGDE